jgi:tetratricopeptide (TPR) repeat protein
MSPSTRCSALLAAISLSLLAACSGDATGEPYELGLAAAKKGDHQAAIVQYEKALGSLTPDAPEYGEIKLAHVESLVQVEPERAMNDFLDLASERPDAFAPNDSMRVFEWLFEAKKYEYAGKVASEFKKSHPDSADLVARMDQRIKEAMDAGLIDQSQLEALKGMGYISNN